MPAGEEDVSSGEDGPRRRDPAEPPGENPALHTILDALARVPTLGGDV